MSEILLILLTLSLSCSLLGSLLVVNNQSPVADALSHSILLGVVLAFFLVQDLDSPFLILGASLFGLLTVYGIDWLQSHSLAYDAATGLVFSFFFALAVILISLFARNVHLDLDMVLLGEVIFAPLDRVTVLGLSLPWGLFKSSLILLIVLSFILLTGNRLKQALFDGRQAGLVGVNLRFLRFLTMSLVSLVIVIAFDIVGVISVISLLLAPAMTALFWSKHFSTFLSLSAGFGLVSVCLGYQIAIQYDLTMSGTCAFVAFMVFLVNLVIYLIRQKLLQK